MGDDKKVILTGATRSTGKCKNCDWILEEDTEGKKIFICKNCGNKKIIAESADNIKRILTEVPDRESDRETICG